MIASLRPRLRFLGICLLAGTAGLAAHPARAQLVISEFMASNVSVLQDEDLEFSDWIELHNTGASSVDLAGWHLTDAADNLTRWTLPATHLSAGGFLVVFASGKDRAGPELHANFSLSADGEYLALVRPDGTTIEHEYAPAFPPQFPDISYGLQTHGANPTLRAGQPGFLIYRTPGAANTCLPGPHPLYSPDSAARIDLTISQTDWDWLMYSPLDESYRSVDIRFRHGDIDLTVTNVGIQCRGNTSRDKQPRSFNVAFNAFIPGQRLLGLKRLNLNSDANDPSLARPKLAHDLSEALDLQAPYGNHVGLVVYGPDWHRGNWVGGEFFDALRNNSQPVDDVFLQQRFGSDRGNLYKCNWRHNEAASLEHKGSTGSSYSSLGNGETYELRHPGSGDTSYQDLADFVATITQTSDTDFPNAIMQVLDVDGFLRRMALDVLSGHWDNYWVNANNYYLFLHPETRRWVFVPYDFDNAFGIRWIGSDWAHQNIYDWKNLGDSRPNTPLANRLFAVPEFSNRYSFYMKQMLDTVFTNALIDPSLFHTRSTLTNSLPFAPGAVPNMLARERDRYSSGDGNWPWWSYDQRFWSYVDAQWPYNGNVPNAYGLTNFIGARRASALAQLNLQNIGPILSDFTMSPSLPRTNDAITVSIRAVDDVAVTNVSFVYSFNGGAIQSVEMVLQPGGAYTATLPAFGAGGTLTWQVRAFDNTGHSTTHPYGGSAYPAAIEIESPAFDLVMTELNYNPYALTAAELSAGFTDPDDFEFLELFNSGNAPMDLAGFMLQDGITATFPAFTLTNGHYAVAVRNTNAFRARYTNDAIRIIGTYSGKLSNSGETIRLENPHGGVIASIPYSDGGAWPGRADGDGSSLELIDPANPDYAAPSAWRSSSEYGGSPGAAGLGPDNRIVVNEVLTHTDPPLSDTIELFNTTEEAIDIGGWFLSDSKSNYRKYAIPASTTLPAGGYIAFNETNHFNTSMGVVSNDFALDGAYGEDVYLLQADAQGRLVRFVDRVEFGAALNGESFGRWPNGSGRLVPMINRTFGAANSGPRIGRVVFSEIHYNPTLGTNDFHLEFVEIFNPGPATEPLDNWQIAGGISFAFPPGASIATGQALTIVSFDPADPTNASLLSEFRTAYGIDASVPLLGGFSGRLDNTGERIQLFSVDEPPAEDPTHYPLILEDEVYYRATDIWPASPNGTGASLSRLLPAGWGDDPASWSASAPPTPGDAGDPVPTFDLTVASAHGTPAPSVGVHAYAENSALSNSVSSPVIAGGYRYLCTGWSLAGHAPLSGTTNWMLMTLTNHATLTWNWSTSLSLSISLDPGGSVVPGGSWHAPGTIVELTAAASNLFTFAGWSGDTHAIVAGDAASPIISIQLDSPVSLHAAFDAIVPTTHVSPSGSHSPPYASWETASTSLHTAVSYAPAGSTVLVAAATYALSSTLTLDKALHLKSADGPAATILDGGNSTRILFLSHADAIAEGFTLQNGNSGSSSGGGARIEPAGSLVRCILRNNTSQRYGGGAALVGGGVLRNCLLTGNTASYRGGGVYTHTYDATPLIESCSLAGNQVTDSEFEEPRGGGGLNANNAVVLRNSIVWNNTAPQSSNMVLYGSGHTVQHTLSGPAQAGAGNLAADPLFTDAPVGDFRPAPGSPAIAAATNQPWMATATDLDSIPRILYGIADLGAFEALSTTVDSDNDGVPDWQEARAGTDPFDSASVLGIVSASAPIQLSNQFVLRWPSVDGRSYRITYATNLISPFAFVAHSNIAADPPHNTFTGTLHSFGPAYYRLEVESAP
jgi:hypothetical protein